MLRGPTLGLHIEGQRRISMDKQKRQLIITSFLVLVLIFAWAKAFQVMKKKSQAKNSQAAISPVNYQQAVYSQPDTETQESQEGQDLKWLRCPFSGKVYAGPAKVMDLELNGLLWDEQDPKAVINSKVFSRQEQVGQYTIIEIEKDRVVLSDGFKEFELKMSR